MWLGVHYGTGLDWSRSHLSYSLVLDVDEDYQKKNQEKTDEDDGQRDDNLHRILLNAW